MKRIPLFLLTAAVLFTLVSCGATHSAADGVGAILAPTDDVTSTTSYSHLSDLDAVNYTDIHAYIRSRIKGTNHGPSSVNAGTDPIYIVDGIQVSSIDGMSPMDVYSVEFIKDSSTAIYGFRGVNGVYNIVTKAGHRAKEAEAEARRAAKEARRAAREAKRK